MKDIDDHTPDILDGAMYLGSLHFSVLRLRAADQTILACVNKCGPPPNVKRSETEIRNVTEMEQRLAQAIDGGAIRQFGNVSDGTGGGALLKPD